jgi:hypothetical protein
MVLAEGGGSAAEHQIHTPPKAGKALLSDKPGMKDYATSVRVDSDCGQGGGRGGGGEALLGL